MVGGGALLLGRLHHVAMDADLGSLGIIALLTLLLLMLHLVLYLSHLIDNTGVSRQPGVVLVSRISAIT